MIEMFARLNKDAVTVDTPVTDVTPEISYTHKSLKLYELHALHVRVDKIRNSNVSRVTPAVPAASETDEVEILGRVGLYADSVPAIHLWRD